MAMWHARMQALEWVAENHQDPAILSMSVAGELSLAVNEAVRRLVESHMVTVGHGSELTLGLANVWRGLLVGSPASLSSLL
jgi:hypothetical protein